MQDYPNYLTWVTTLAQRDSAMLGLGAATLFVFVWLANGRWLLPKYMPFIRSVVLIDFYLTAAFLFVYRLLKGG